MKRYSILVAALLALLAPSLLHAQDAGEPLTFAGHALTPTGPPAGISLAEGGKVLVVERSSVMLDGLEFAEGVIEFDIAFDDQRGFGGINWHYGEDGTGEYFYLRKHKSGLPDAAQYTPVRGGLTSWQVFHDRNATAPFAFTHDGWNRLKIVVAGDKADFYLNGSPKPLLHVPDLASDRGSGGIGFRASGPEGRIRIADLTVRPLREGEGIVGSPAKVAPPPAGVIGSWSVSPGFAEERVAGQLTLPADLAALRSDSAVRAEPTGIADLSRAARIEDGADTVLASARIVSDRARSVRLRFGYSDRVRLYLNGELLFDGDAGFRRRDFFFLGNVGFHDAVVLPLNEGENTLVAAVSETFGGWAVAGAIEDGEGLRIPAQ